MICMFQLVKAFIGDADYLVGLIAVLGKGGDAVVHADGYTHLEVGYGFFKNDANAAAESQSLGCIGLREEKSEFVASDAKGRVRGAQSFFECCRGGAQNFIAAGMAVLIVDFLEAMQIKNHETERLAVTAGAIEFFFEGFAKEAPVVKAGEGIGNGVELQLLQFVVLDENGNAEKTGRSEHIHKGCFQGNLTLHMLAEFAATSEHLIPEFDTLRLLKIEVGDGAEVALEKLATRGYVKAFERVRKQLEIRIFNRQTRGRRGAGAGHNRYTPDFSLSPRGLGKAQYGFLFL